MVDQVYLPFLRDSSFIIRRISSIYISTLSTAARILRSFLVTLFSLWLSTCCHFFSLWLSTCCHFYYSALPRSFANEEAGKRGKGISFNLNGAAPAPAVILDSRPACLSNGLSTQAIQRF